MLRQISSCTNIFIAFLTHINFLLLVLSASLWLASVSYLADDWWLLLGSLLSRLYRWGPENTLMNFFSSCRVIQLIFQLVLNFFFFLRSANVVFLLLLSRRKNERFFPIFLILRSRFFAPFFSCFFFFSTTERKFLFARLIYVSTHFRIEYTSSYIDYRNARLLSFADSDGAHFAIKLWTFCNLRW